MTSTTHQTRQRKPLIVRGGRLVTPVGQAAEITIKPLVIGRDELCDIVLADPEVSAAHCEVLADSQGVLVRDLDSKNGTFIGSVRVREALLTGACVLQIGSSRISFEPGGKEHVDVPSGEYFGDLVGVSPRMRLLFRQLAEIAPTNLFVLITGETGTGKELVARAIHEHSPRKNGPFVVVDCTTIVGNLAESLLFGHERGAFTGATERSDGAFQEANGGTLFLDEIGDLPLELQPKLLRALAEGRVKRVGPSAYQSIDVRVIAATHKNLLRDLNTNRFRSDLYFRIAQIGVELPPLRERVEDIPAIVRAVCTRIDKADRTAEILDTIAGFVEQHHWPGNIRELHHLVSALAQLPPDGASLSTLLTQAAGKEITGPTAPFTQAKKDAIFAFESKYFRDLFEATAGNISEMARRSGMERHHVRNHLKKLGIKGGAES